MSPAEQLKNCNFKKMIAKLVIMIMVQRVVVKVMVRVVVVDL